MDGYLQVVPSCHHRKIITKGTHYCTGGVYQSCERQRIKIIGRQREMAGRFDSSYAQELTGQDSGAAVEEEDD